MGQAIKKIESSIRSTGRNIKKNIKGAVKDFKGKKKAVNDLGTMVDKASTAYATENRKQSKAGIGTTAYKKNKQAYSDLFNQGKPRAATDLKNRNNELAKIYGRQFE